MSGGGEDTYYTDADTAKQGGLRPHQRYVTVRWLTETAQDGERLVDEILATGCRLEMMDPATCWMNVNGLRVWIRAVRLPGRRDPVLWITATPESCAPAGEAAS